MNRNTEGVAHAQFNDPRNISRGFGRVIYAAATTDAHGVYHPEGWVLPGGVRTTVRARAEAVADRIHDISTNSRKH
jgi:hypothetical protein